MAKKQIATFLGPNKGLSVVGNRVYAFSGAIGVDGTEKDLLNFTTGDDLIPCTIQFNYVQAATEDFFYRVYFNNQLVQGYLTTHSTQYTSPDNLIPIIIPPLTSVKLTAQNVDDNNERTQLVSITGKVLDA